MGRFITIHPSARHVGRGFPEAQPSAIIFLQLLLNDRELLGDEFANKSWNNWINWTIIVIFWFCR